MHSKTKQLAILACMLMALWIGIEVYTDEVTVTQAESTQSDTSKENDTFIVKNSNNSNDSVNPNSIEVIVDVNTGVEYILYSDHIGLSITPRLNSDGSLYQASTENK